MRVTLRDGMRELVATRGMLCSRHGFSISFSAACVVLFIELILYFLFFSRRVAHGKFGAFLLLSWHECGAEEEDLAWDRCSILVLQ